jgi:hypothetical protein
MGLPRGLADDVRADWAALARATAAPATLDAPAVAGLPEPARRWLAHAIAGGAPLLTSVELRMHGEIRLGRWRLLNAVPVMTADGDDVTRSAAGRHAGELLVACPAAALGPDVTWRPADEDRAVASVSVGDRVHDVTLTIAATGALTELVMERWGNPGGEPFGRHVFGAVLRDEARFGGFAIPREVTAGWHCGTQRWPEGQFIRYSIDAARFR